MRIDLHWEKAQCAHRVVTRKLQLSVVQYRVKYRRAEEVLLGETYNHHLVRVFTVAARREQTPLLQSGGVTDTLGWVALGGVEGLPTLRGAGG